MIAIFKREIKNYLKRPLFWVGVLLVLYGVFHAISPYLTTHYLEQGEKIVNDYPDAVHSGDVHEGYIPANSEKRWEIWLGQIKKTLTDEFEMSDLEAQSITSKLADMELEEAVVYLEKNMTGTEQDIYMKTVLIIKEQQKNSTHIWIKN